MAMRPTTKKICLIAAAACLALPILAFAAQTVYDPTNSGLVDAGKAAQVNTSQDLPTVIGTAIKAALGLVGMIFLGLMIYAGALWMIARGDETKVDKAKNTIIAAIIGLIIVVGAYAITSFVVRAFNQPQSTGGNPVVDCNGSESCQGNTTYTKCLEGRCVAP
jgi:hypothetical protein